MRWILVALIAVSCATNRPGTYTVPREGVAQASPAAVIETAGQWLSGHGFIITAQSGSHITASSDLRMVEGRVVDAWSGLDHDTLAFDCGGPPAGGRGYVTEAVVSVSVEPSATVGATVVRVNMQPRAATWGLQGCVSTGLVERSILGAVGATTR